MSLGFTEDSLLMGPAGVEVVHPFGTWAGRFPSGHPSGFTCGVDRPIPVFTGQWRVECTTCGL